MPSLEKRWTEWTWCSGCSISDTTVHLEQLLKRVFKPKSAIFLVSIWGPWLGSWTVLTWSLVLWKLQTKLEIPRELHVKASEPRQQKKSDPKVNILQNDKRGCLIPVSFMLMMWYGYGIWEVLPAPQQSQLGLPESSLKNSATFRHGRFLQHVPLRQLIQGVRVRAKVRI